MIIGSRWGLGFANLGALLMSFGIPYDSDSGRDYAGAISAIMCGQAYLTSARIAEAMGPFPGYQKNEEPFLEVIRMHRDSVNKINNRTIPTALYQGAKSSWNDAYELGRRSGYKNGQMTVIAVPTGHHRLHDGLRNTTGIEPDLALVKYKTLVGGGVIKIVNQTVPSALVKLGYTATQVEAIVSHIDATGTIEGVASAGKPEHPGGLRLQFPSAELRHAIDPLHGAFEHDGGGAAVRIRRDFEDH